MITAQRSARSSGSGRRRPPIDAGRRVGAAIAGLPTITLPELIMQAELQHRMDTKHVVAAEQFTAWLDRLGPGLRVLEIAGRRSFGYESVYFDTPDLLTFRQHRQGRRRRYKIRTRSYTDSGDCTVEIKLEGHRGATVKHRWPHPVADRDHLTAPARARLAEVLTRDGIAVPSALAPVQRLDYRRSTLLLADGPVRITCDTDLRYRSADGAAVGPDDRVIVEVKAVSDRNAAVRSLTALGVRPTEISKYCVGIALLTGESANRWHRVIKRYFRTAGAAGTVLDPAGTASRRWW